MKPKDKKMMKANDSKIDLRPYYTFGLPLLGLMGVIALTGVVLAIVAYFLF